jgi:hypothetical protein
MAQLSEWLQIMLAEIARKDDETQRATEEANQRRLDPPLTEPSASESPAPEIPST